jgi:hypothetical protein
MNLNETQKPQLNIGAVSGSIRITKAASFNQRAIIPHCNWFDNHEYFIIKDDGEKIIFQKCFMEVPKKAYRLPKTKVFTVLSDAELGTFEICADETNEDEAVVYYR